MRVSQMYGVSLLPSYSSALSGFGPKEAMATTHHMYGRGPSASLYGNTLYSSQCRCHTHALNSYASFRHANYQTTPRHTPCAHTCTVHTRFAPMRGMGPGRLGGGGHVLQTSEREKAVSAEIGSLEASNGFSPKRSSMRLLMPASTHMQPSLFIASSLTLRVVCLACPRSRLLLSRPEKRQLDGLTY